MNHSRITEIMLPLLALAGALLFASACGRSTSEAPVSANTQNKVATQTPAVNAARVTVQEVSASVQTTGSFAAEETSRVAPDSPGVIASTSVDVGSLVKEGQVIARLDDQGRAKA